MCGKLTPSDALPELEPAAIDSLKLVVPQARVIDDLDDDVTAAFERAIAVLSDAGVSIRHEPMPVLDQCDDFFPDRALVLYEVFQHHRTMLEEHGDEYDPFVGKRIMTGAEISDDEQQSRYQERNQLVDAFHRHFDQLEIDAVVYPTVPCIPPALAETDDPSDETKINLRCLRNTATINHVDGCSISLPCQQPGQAPVGLMLSARNRDDEKLYCIAKSIEMILRDSHPAD